MTKLYDKIKNTILETIPSFCILLLLFMPAFVTAGSISGNIANSPDDEECVADFSYYAEGSVDKPNIFQFINPSVGNIVSVEWDFGDGGFSDQFNPGHEFPGVGTYTVCLTVFCADSLGMICCFDSVCKSIIVDYNIGGHVFAGGYPINSGRAWLYKIEDEIIPYDMAYFDTLGYYFFYQIPEGEYLVKASATLNSSYYNSYFPVYYGDQIVWNNAERINVYNNNWELDIHLEAINIQTTGNGSIQGKAIDFKTGEPLADLELLLTDLAYEPISYEFTDQNGFFHLTNLEYGTYYLTAEITGFYCNSMMVTITEENNQIIDLEYIVNQGTYVGLNNRIDTQNKEISLQIYPNPCRELVNINIKALNNEFTPGVYNLKIGDMYGTIIYQRQLNSLNEKLEIDVKQLPYGIYSVVLQNNQQVFSKNKMLIIH